MCGIGAIIGKGWTENQLTAMGKAMKHRGPDGDGVAFDDGMEIGLAHTRLAIIDLDRRAKQPMSTPDGMQVVVFNGEIYNYQELRSELSEYEYRTSSDTEVILAAYSRWGEECVQKLRGMFTFIIWDRTARKVFCARDRFGIKQLYFCLDGDHLYLASEIKGILAAGVKAESNNEAWADYLVHGHSDHTEETFFKGVYGLKAGHTLTVDDMGSAFSRYYHLPSHTLAKKPLNDKEAVEEFRLRFYDSASKHMRSDVPLVANLSDGVDSNALYQAMWSVAREQPVSATFNFNHPSEKHIRSAAALMKFMEGPYGGMSTLEYAGLHADLARRGFKVALEGQCADELFGGYAYYQTPELNLYQDGTEHLRVSCVDPDIIALASPAPIEKPYEDDVMNRCYRDLMYTKVPRVLRMNDRLSMASGVELRVPYLDHPLVEFAFSLSHEYRIRGGVGKWILREAMKGILPDKVRKAPKTADPTPQREWLREGKWRELVGDTIHSPDFDRGFFDVAQVRSQFQDFCEKGVDNSFFIWQWLMVDMWFRTFIEVPVEAPVG